MPTADGPQAEGGIPSSDDLVHVGMDPSMHEIFYAILRPGEDRLTADQIPNDADSVRTLITKLGDRARLAVCYEAGPGGYAGCTPAGVGGRRL